MLTIPSKNNAFIEGPILDCSYQDQSSLQLIIDSECNIELFREAINEPGEKLAVEQNNNGVSYKEFHLKDRNKGTPVFSRIIKDDSNCMVITGTSLDSISEHTKSLWVIDKGELIGSE